MPQPPSPFGTQFQVELPAGGSMYLQTAEEVEMWNRSSERYQEDFHLTKTNDLVLLGAILQQQVTLFRAQMALNGTEPELDNSGIPTGRYIQKKLDADDTGAYIRMLNSATEQIQKIEKSLGIDKVTRESGGQMSVSNYLTTLKRAAHLRGIHITERTKKYEEVANELRWRIRVLRNADAEDRAYHDITPESILKFAEDKLEEILQHDKDFAKEWGKVYAGQL